MFPTRKKLYGINGIVNGCPWIEKIDNGKNKILRRKPAYGGQAAGYLTRPAECGIDIA